MNLRARLILAFFALSVVPLGALTFYTYVSNAKALRDAAEREADLLAAELGQRMQLVTTQLGQRVEYLMEISALEAEVTRASEERKTATVVAPEPMAAADSDVLATSVAKVLGDAAILLSNVTLEDMRFTGRRGRPPGPPPGMTVDVGRGAAAGGAGAGGAGAGGAGAGQATRTNPARGAGASGPPASQRQRPHPQPGTAPPAGNAQTRSTPPPPPGPPPPKPPSTPTILVPTDPTAPMDATTRLKIDLAPIQRAILREIVPDGRLDNLSAEQRQRVVEELKQRVLGIEKGIQLGAEAIQKHADAIRQQEAAQAKAQTQAPAGAATSTTSQRSASAPSSSSSSTSSKPPADTAMPSKPVATKRSSSLSGNKLDVKFEENGKVVRQANVELNLPNVLATVFSTTHRDRGEVPFAIDKDGRIYTPSEEERQKVVSFGAVATPSGPSTTRQGDWIVVTTKDPSGSGLKMGIARPVGDSLTLLRRATARNAAIGLGFIGLALIGIVPLSSRLTRNLSTLSEGVRRIALGDYRARVTVKGSDEVSALATAFNQMAQDVEKHQRATVEQERIKRELELGRQIQHDMLPHSPFRLGPTEIKGVSVPAREVGGDFFNYFETPSGQIALLVGDVSGKGVGAALLMANIQASLRTRLALGQDLSALAEEIDRDIEAGSPAPVYATLFVGILDPVTRVLRFVNAGHNPQYILRRDGGLSRMVSTGLPVGLFAGHGYQEQRVELGAGDLLFFYTDGCVEAENEAGDMFSAERLEALLTSLAPVGGGGDVLANVEAAITKYRGNREPFDDATMMTVAVG